MFQPPRLTNAGKALYNRTLAGEGIQFTKIKLGKGTLTDPIATMTDLVDLVTEIDASVSQTGDNSYVDISGSFSNAGMQDGFYWREIGLFAADPEAPEERERDILYCYQNAYDTADFIPAASVEIVEKHITIPVIVADTENVSCLIDHSLIFVTRGELKKIIDERMERDVTADYEQWSQAAGGYKPVLEFFLSDALQDPGAYAVYAAGYTWKLRYTVASGGDGSSVWRWISCYTEDGFFAAELYCNKNLVISFDPDGGTYKVYGKDLAFWNDLQPYDMSIERLEKSVAALESRISALGG